MSKKVFSKEKYIEWCKQEQFPYDDCDWPDDCDGLTEEEMNEIGYDTEDVWMVEVNNNVD